MGITHGETRFRDATKLQFSNISLIPLSDFPPPNFPDIFSRLIIAVLKGFFFCSASFYPILFYSFF